MIRKYIPTDLPSILTIWLESNLQAHSFIPASYWREHVDYMKQVLPDAELYVYEADGKVVAFVGLMEDYIAGIFTEQEFRSQGIGKQLLAYLKASHQRLTLSVYAKNERAIQFYTREGFQVIEEQTESDHQEKEFLMQWQ